MHLARFPRVKLFPAPTPLHRLENLSRHLGGPDIWIKREDCTVVATGGNKVRKLEWLIGEARAQGVKTYVIPGGGSNTTGAIGYVSCAQELVRQADEMGLKIDRLVTATGSAGTHAGLVVGIEGENAGIPILGIGVRLPKDRQEANVFRLAEATADRVGLRGGIARSAVVANCDYVGDGYGIPTPGMAEAVQMMARHEGILLDPVYSGKAMAGMIDLIRKGEIGKHETVVFLHTGGAVGLFGYTGFFEQAMGV